MSDFVISVQNVSKTYRMWNTPAARLTSAVLQTAARTFPEYTTLRKNLEVRIKRRYRDFVALHDVSLQIKKGESVGILGRNGSGKSTLLQIIAGTLLPTTGHVKVSGRVAALLELGSGFNPEFSGRENVYLNASVLGLSRYEIEKRFDEIAAFAEIGDHIDQPVKTYSSGMMMRLAFAVQTAVDPEVLIVDEALSVGDAPFQAKCFDRIRRVQSSGCSILFVSHDVGSVRSLCSRALLLSHGTQIIAGAAKEVADAYAMLCMKEQGIKVGTAQQNPIAPPRANLDANPAFEKQAGLRRAGIGTVRFVDCFLENAEGQRVSVVEPDEKTTVNWILCANEDFEGEVVLSLTIKTLKGQDVMSGTDKKTDHRIRLKKGELCLARMPYRFPLRGEHYYFTSSLFEFPETRKFQHDLINFKEARLLDLVEYACHFEVNWVRRWCHYGPVQQDAPIEFSATIRQSSALASS